MKLKKWPLVLAGLILCAGIAGMVLVLQPLNTTWVEIIQDGTVLYGFDLMQAEDQTIEVAYEGRINTIEIRDHRIHMLAAECPDQTCVHTGWLESAVPIVCLPNRLVIQFAESGGAVDATAG